MPICDIPACNCGQNHSKMPNDKSLMERLEAARRDAWSRELPEMAITISDAIDALRAAEEMARFVLPAMESAWYELEPGNGVMGDQFIRQNDMQKRIEKARAYLAKFCGGER